MDHIYYCSSFAVLHDYEVFGVVKKKVIEGNNGRMIELT